MRLSIINRVRFLLLCLANFLLYPFFWIASIIFRKNIAEFQISLIWLFNPNFAAMLNAQAKFESNNFKSNAWVNHNNPWGMTRARVRDTTQKESLNWGGEYGNSGAGYSHKFAGLYDIYLYFKQFENWKDFTLYLPDDKGAGASFTMYITWLKERGYFGASLNDYQQGVGAYYQGGGRIRTYWTVILSILIGGVSLYLLFKFIRKYKTKYKKK